MRTLHPGCSCGIEAPPQLWSGDPACPEHLGDPFGTFQRFNVQMRTFHPGRIYGTFRRSLLAFPSSPRPTRHFERSGPTFSGGHTAHPSFRTQQADCFLRIRSCECVGPRREKSLFSCISHLKPTLLLSQFPPWSVPSTFTSWPASPAFSTSV